jgi:hypothetical protein
MTRQKNESQDVFIDQLQKRVDSALDSRDMTDIAAAQLEVQFAMLQCLHQMDWKLWELYNKFGT